MTLEDIALTMTPGVGTTSAVHLLDHFGSAGRVFAASQSELVEGAELREDVALQIVRRVAFADAEREVRYCAKNRIEALASTDAEYPALLREIADYPHVIYVQGDVEALNGRSVAMVGTRKYTSYGIRMCSELIAALAERVPDLCIVSGLALGLDAACHHAALTAGVPTVAVVPNTLPDVVPVQHTALAREIIAKGGALVSEYNSKAKQKGQFYTARNRIVAGLCAGTVVLESPIDGGSLITAAFADGYNRVVMAVPGRVGDSASLGTNMLIRNRKGQMILSAEDIVRELMWDMELPLKQATKQASTMELSEDEVRVMRCFATTDSISADSIGEMCEMGTGELSALLLGLEMSGVVKQLPGNRYIRLVDYNLG